MGIPDQAVSGTYIVGGMEAIQTTANESGKQGEPASLAASG